MTSARAFLPLVLALAFGWASPSALAQWREPEASQLPPAVLQSLPGGPQGYTAEAFRATPPAILATMAAALQAQEQGDLASAAAGYERVLRETERTMARDGVSDAQAAIFLADLLPRYGRLLSALGRLDEAAKQFERALAVEPHAKAAPADPRRASFERRYRTSLAASQMVRAMNSAQLLVDGDHAADVQAQFSARIPASHDAAVMLAEIRARQGRGTEVLALWQEQIRPRVEHDLQAPDASGWPPFAAMNTLAGVPVMRAPEQFLAEVDLLRSANALGTAGHPSEALDALDQALAVNLDRLQSFTSRLAVPAMQLEAFQQRRLIVSAAVAAALAPEADPARWPRLVAAMASTKALGARFAALRRTILATAPERSVAAARSLVETLDRQVLSLPLTGPAGVTAWGNWQNQYAAAIAPVTELLLRRGLASVFTDGEAILQRARQKLGDRAWIGFMVYTPTEPGTSALLPQRYVRYTIAGSEATVTDIGKRSDIDRKVARWRSAVAEGADASVAGGADPLATALLGDLTPAVRNSRSWVVEQDGILSLVPFEALRDDVGLVIDRHTIRYATSMAQFAKAAVPASTNQTAVVIADPRYDSEPRQVTLRASLRSGRGEKLSDLGFAQLPETRVESRAVQQSLERLGVATQVILGPDATAAAVRAVRAPRFVHVAAHAFILAPSVEASPSQAAAVGVLVPGVLSGLALTPDAADGGLLLAQELAGLDLRGTQLVVLSACDTGNGLVDVGEGLSGLRRAVEEAGARASLTSLWPVPSGPTVELMTAFYRALAAGKAHSDSLREAKLQLRSRGAPVQDWAGFVLAGEDR